MSRFNKNLEKSHLTEHEKYHSMALVMMGILTMVVSLILYFGLHIPPIIGMLLFAVGGGLIGFVWGYIGAVEAERDGD